VTLIRFLCSGGFNTAVTYAIYLAALWVMPYWAAYTTAYVVGIVLAYLMNRYWVFRQHRGTLTVALLPLVYVAQYIAGMLIVWAWVRLAGLDARWAPLASVAITVPLTYLLSKRIFTKRP